MLFKKEPRKPGPNDWGTAVVMNPGEVAKMQDEITLSRRLNNTLIVLLCLSMLCNMGFVVYSSFLTKQVNTASRTAGVFEKLLNDCKRKDKVTSSALDALTRSHTSLMDASKEIKEVEGNSWGRRFRITQYVPHAGGINADSDPTTTATMMKADPKLRIVAVDPALIPYGSKLWIEGIGWYQAQDTGGAIKGYRLDVMAKSLDAAKKFGAQERFVIVVPPSKT